jgi:hypothetical protein
MSLSSSRSFPPFVEPEGSLPCSPATGPYLLAICRSFNIVAHLCVGLLNGLYPSKFRNKILCKFLSSLMRAACFAQLVLYDMITRLGLYLNIKLGRDCILCRSFIDILTFHIRCSATFADGTVPLNNPGKKTRS